MFVLVFVASGVEIARGVGVAVFLIVFHKNEKSTVVDGENAAA
ncbi:hypothetical protein AB2G07_25685 (plasmid) [Escherichia coli]